jgi:hypothetical protein
VKRVLEILWCSNVLDIVAVETKPEADNHGARRASQTSLCHSMLESLGLERENAFWCHQSCSLLNESVLP